MKYLKLFENTYYQEETKSEFFKDVPFSDEELSILKNHLDKKEDNIRTYWLDSASGSGSMKLANRYKRGYVYELMNRNMLLAYLEKSEDEWYYLTIPKGVGGIFRYPDDITYKCDQINGLIKCIDDEAIDRDLKKYSR